MANYRYTASVFDFGRDMYGNSTAHWELWDHKYGMVHTSGKRRQQTGYDGTHAEAVLCYLNKLTGRSYETVRIKRGGSRCGGLMRVAFRLKRPDRRPEQGVRT